MVLSIQPQTDARRVGAAGLWQAVTKDGGGRLAIAVLGVMALAAIAAPWLAPFPPNDQLGLIALKSRPPSLAHWFGTDPYSRDVFSRVLYGARVSLRTGVMAAALAASAGLIWGAIAGFFGGRTDAIMMRIVDMLLAIPRVLLILTIIALWPRVTPELLIVVIGLTGWFGVSRLARSVAQSVRTREYVAAAAALGASKWRILRTHVVPHAVAPVLVAATVAVAQVVILEAGLAFLGRGIPEPDASWGNIIYLGRESIAVTWWLTLFPGLLLICTALSTNALADRLRSSLNPKQVHGS